MLTDAWHVHTWRLVSTLLRSSQTHYHLHHRWFHHNHTTTHNDHYHRYNHTWHLVNTSNIRISPTQLCSSEKSLSTSSLPITCHNYQRNSKNYMPICVAPQIHQHYHHICHINMIMIGIKTKVFILKITVTHWLTPLFCFVPQEISSWLGKS